MNLTEIKNATHEELMDYLEMYGVNLRGQPIGLKRLRDKAQEIYWKKRQNDGFGFGNVLGGSY